MRFPSIKAVAKELREANANVPKRRDEDEGTDVRLQVYADGSFAIRVGDSSYDQDHRGFWACGTLDGKRFDSEGMAKEMLEQAKEQEAMGAES